MAIKFKNASAAFLCAFALSAGALAVSVKDSALDADDFFGDFESRSWTVANGLPGNTITSLIQDRTGFICIGTYDGFTRFDGVEFLTLNRSYDDKYNFSSARSLMQDTRGNMWVGSNDEGVARISPNWSVKMFTLREGLPNNSIRAIEEDIDGNIWIGTADGVAYITPQDKIVYPEGLEEYNDEHILVASLYCDTAGRMWVTSLNADSVYFFADGRFTRYEGIKSVEHPSVNIIEQDARGAFWFGVSPNFAVKIESGVETLYNIGHGAQSGTIVNTIMQDSQGNMWFGLDNGVAVLHDGKMSFYDQSQGLIDNRVNKIVEDKEKNIWLATDRGGLEKLSLSKFKTVPMPTAINSIAQDDARALVWLGGDNGLYCRDLSLRPVTNRETEYCKDTRIRHVAVAKDGSLLVSAYEKFGQLRFFPDGSVTSWTKKNGLAGNKVRVAVEISNGDLYVGTTTGLSIIENGTGRIISLTRDDGLPNEYIMCVFEDARGLVWVGTDGGGVFTMRDRKIESIYTSAYKKTGALSFSSDTCIIGNVIFKISELKNGEIWFCTGTGISRLRGGQFTNFSSTNGLGTDSVFQVITEFSDKMWMTSNRGISCVKISQLEDLAAQKIQKVNAKFFSSSDGVHSNGATSTSLSMKDKFGRIWFTMVDGFVVYDPVKTTADKLMPIALIDKITVDNKEHLYDGDKITIPPEAKRVVIKYTSPGFVSPEQTLFRYRLAGFDSTYSDWSPDRSVSYTNLKPGSYEFTVISQNGNEVEGPLSESLTMVKEPYFWQLWYFWPLVIVFSLLAIALIILARIKQMKRYQKQLETEVQKQTVELRQRTRDIEIEKNKSEQLLLNILPPSVAKELSDDLNKVVADQYDNVTILFADIVGFTKMSSGMRAREVVNMLNELFSKFDLRARSESIEKIKTIGDAYMAACGLEHDANAADCACRMVDFARGMIADISEYNKSSGQSLQMRIGMNTGPLVAGVIGKTKFIYDIWGDAVNVASRMESTSAPGRIHVTEQTYFYTKEKNDFEFPIEIEVKGKGMMKTYFVKQ